jgi:hypothetical protein
MAGHQPPDLQPDQQHTAWQWLDAAQAETDESVHPYVRAYAAWVKSKG